VAEKIPADLHLFFGSQTAALRDLEQLVELVFAHRVIRVENRLAVEVAISA
jgi:hypothetical protein